MMDVRDLFGLVVYLRLFIYVRVCMYVRILEAVDIHVSLGYDYITYPRQDKK